MLTLFSPFSWFRLVAFKSLDIANADLRTFDLWFLGHVGCHKELRKQYKQRQYIHNVGNDDPLW